MEANKCCRAFISTCSRILFTEETPFFLYGQQLPPKLAPARPDANASRLRRQGTGEFWNEMVVTSAPIGNRVTKTGDCDGSNVAGIIPALVLT